MNPPTGTAVCLVGVLAAGGLGALVSRNDEVSRRWRTWLVAAPLVTGCLWLGGPGAVLLAAGLGVVGAVEYGRLAGLGSTDSVLAGLAAVVLPLVAWQRPGQLGRVLAGALLAAALVPVFGGDAAAGARRAAAGVFGTAWLGALSGLVLLGPAALPVVFAVCVADVGAWCAGRRFGGPALSALSPGKRWTGWPAERRPGRRRWPRRPRSAPGVACSRPGTWSRSWRARLWVTWWSR